MKHASKILTIGLTVLGGAVLLTGCKASPCTSPDGGTVDNCYQVQALTKYNGTVITQTAAWSASKSVTVSNTNGKITVVADGTDATKVSVEAAPYDMETGDPQGKQAAIDAMQNKLHVIVAADTATGNVAVSGDGTGYLGCAMTVHLPSAFDGALVVAGSSGDVTVTTVPTSPSATVSASAGDVIVNGAAGHLSITGKASNVTVSANPSGSGNSITTDVGDITATIPATADLAITAKCDRGGPVTLASSMTNATLAADKMSAGITLGAGADALTVQTGLGSITFQ
jgi:hypothetical protein